MCITWRIILADDHPIVVNAVRQMLERDGNRIEAVAESAPHLLEILEHTPCDLLITDLSMPLEGTVDGLPLLTVIRRRWPEIPVIVLTMATNPGILQAILDTGVLGLINKVDALSELRAAVLSIHHGQPYVSRATRRLLTQAATGRINLATQLSPRETEVIRLFASGKTVTDIARHLNRSVKTISTQKNEAMAKLGLRSDFELYAYARENGLVS